MSSCPMVWVLVGFRRFGCWFYKVQQLVAVVHRLQGYRCVICLKFAKVGFLADFCTATRIAGSEVRQNAGLPFLPGGFAGRQPDRARGLSHCREALVMSAAIGAVDSQNFQNLHTGRRFCLQEAKLLDFLLFAQYFDAEMAGCQ